MNKALFTFMLYLLFNLHDTSNVHPDLSFIPSLYFPSYLPAFSSPSHSLTPASHTQWPKSLSLPFPMDNLFSFFSFLSLSSLLTIFSSFCLCYFLLYFCPSFHTSLLHLCSSLSVNSCYHCFCTFSIISSRLFFLYVCHIKGADSSDKPRQLLPNSAAFCLVLHLTTTSSFIRNLFSSKKLPCTKKQKDKFSN